MIRKRAEDKVQIVLHGTNGFPPHIMQECIRHGVTRVNVNKIVMNPYFDFMANRTDTHLLTRLVAEGTDTIQKKTEEWMDIIGSSGKA